MDEWADVIYDIEDHLTQLEDNIPALGACTINKIGVIRKAGESDQSWYKCSNDVPVTVDGELVDYNWRLAASAEADTVGFGEKTDIQNGKIFKGNLTIPHDNYYIYTGNSWRKATTLEMDTHDKSTHLRWPGAQDGDYRAGTVDTNVYYVYDAEESQWRLTTSELDHDPDLRGCTVARSNSVDGNVRGELVPKEIDGQTTYYVCLDNLWREASTPRWDTRGKTCNPRDRGVTYGIETANVYVCEVDTFRTLTESEEWIRSVRDEKGRVRCGPKDNGTKVKLKSVNTQYYCRDGYYEWDEIPEIKDTIPDVHLGPEYIVDTLNNKYATVAIGTQVWMASNLRVETEGAFMHKDRSLDSVAIFGRLYNHDDASRLCGKMSAPGVATNGTYRLPNEEDWNILLSHAHDMDYPARAFKSKDTWASKATAGDDRFSFGAVRAGSCTYNEKYDRLWCSDIDMLGAYFTTADYEIDDSGEPWYGQMSFYYDNAYVFENGINDNTVLLSVRCIRDLNIPPPPKNPYK